MPFDSPLSRKDVLTSLLAGLATASLPVGALAQSMPKPEEITLEDLKAAEKLVGLDFSEAERKEILAEVRSLRTGYSRVRAMPIAATTEVPLAYVPPHGGTQPGTKVAARPSRINLRRPLRDEDVAFLSIGELGHLLRTRQITSVELTKLYLSRLERYGKELLCVVTLMPERALREAEEADREIAAGRFRGPLHGIPYGAKDLFAAKGAPTTWGAAPYKDQTFDFDSAVVERLHAAGAVLVAKLSMGALAQGDVWFGGTTKNPWNRQQGSSGSSAGSAAATAAGLVAFGIGTETSGSIMSPSLRCRVTGLRPTFGRVSRFGAMELSFSLDKVGPLCRSAEDCALVLAALAGADPRDPSSVDRPFEYPRRVEMRRVKVGWVGDAKALDADEAVKRLRALGASVEAANVAPFPSSLYAILDAEAGSAFDAFTRGEAIHRLGDSSWPQTFRASRFVPAVEYLQAQRARTLMVRQFEKDTAPYDVLLGPGIGGAAFSQANFAGYPSVLLPFGDDGKGNSLGRAVIGHPYQEDRLLAIAKAIQDGFDYHHRRPTL